MRWSRFNHFDPISLTAPPREKTYLPREAASFSSPLRKMTRRSSSVSRGDAGLKRNTGHMTLPPFRATQRLKTGKVWQEQGRMTNFRRSTLRCCFGEKSGLPFYHRKLAGKNIPDVKIMRQLILSWTSLDTEKSSSAWTRGFYSADNINGLYKEHYKVYCRCQHPIELRKAVHKGSW